MDREGKALAERIVRLRERQGLTQADVALRIGVPRPSLSKMENGQQQVSIANLLRLADVFGVRVEWLLSEPPASIVSHRGESREPLARIDAEVERMAREVEFLAGERESGLAEVLDALPERAHQGKDAAGMDALADLCRERVGLAGGGPVHDIGNLLAQFGVLIFSLSLGVGQADAGTVLLDRGAVSVVNADLRTGKRRLAAAHELGHALIADDYAIDYHLGESSRNVETLLDRFARAFLLPETEVNSRWIELEGNENPRAAAVRIASEYRVDMATLAKRLGEISSVSMDVQNAVRNARTTRDDIVEFGLVTADELRVGFLPEEYRNAVYRLYEDELLSPERAIDLLQGTATVGDLPELPPRHENEIWNYV